MQTRLVFKLFICSLPLLSSCTKQHEDEKFEFLFTGHPRLGDVPSRPVLPNMDQINQNQNQLNQDQLEANKRKQDVFKTLGLDSSKPVEK